MKARVFVTGATGFIGRRLIRRLLAEHGARDVACLVGPPANPGEAAALESYRKLGLSLIEGDLLSERVSAVAAPTASFVFHLAASLELGAPERRLRVNDEGTRRLLEWLGEAARGARVVYVSSVAVHDRRAPAAAPISEESPFEPRTAYGLTKLRGERWLRERAAAQGYTWTVARLPTVYGPGQREGGLFDTLLKLAPAGAWLARLDWPGRTSVIHVDDVADALATLAHEPAAAGQAYCVAADECPTVGQIARLAARAAGRELSAVTIPDTLLAAARFLAWNRALRTILPGPARLALWRLSLMVSDGFWFDTAKFRRVYKKPLRTLEEGLVGLSPLPRSGRG